jgi:transposase
MARFKYTDNSQGLFLTVNLEEQLLPGTFEWTLDYLIDRLDLSLFEQNYRNDEKGANAYHPGVLLKIIMFCYSKGILSSRKMEEACKTNIILKALARDSEPDHATIAAFVSTNSEAVQDLFTQVLLQCGELKLITGEMFAIDGCKLPSNASKEWSGKVKELQTKRDKLKEYIGRVLAQHRKLDRDERTDRKQKPFAQTMGDKKERRKRQIDRLEKKLKKLDTFLETAEPKKGVAGQEVQANITDEESGRMKGPHGYIQGYNGIAAADSGNQVIITAEVVGSAAESGCFPEMLDSLEENMKTLTGKEKPLKKSLCLGDTGYFSEDNLQAAKEREINVLIPDAQFRQRDPYYADRKEQTYSKGKKKKYGIQDFEYNKKENCYICPYGKKLSYKGKIQLRNNSGKKYQSLRRDCVNCPLIEKCITKRQGKYSVRTIFIVDPKYGENLSEKMRKKIDDMANRELYSRRIQIIEPVFADMAYCKGMNRFTLRTQKKVNIQWLLYCMVHNIGKCMKPLMERYGT